MDKKPTDFLPKTPTAWVAFGASATISAAVGGLVFFYVHRTLKDIVN